MTTLDYLYRWRSDSMFIHSDDDSKSEDEEDESIIEVKDSDAERSEPELEIRPNVDSSDGGISETSQDYKVVIIAISGLNENKVGLNYADSGLPSDVVYYDYAVDRLFGPQADSTSIKNITIGLLDLAIEWLDVSTGDETTPAHTVLVFVARDLGGSVLKRALIEASHDSAYLRVLQHTALLMFASTPHQSTYKDGWSDILLRLLDSESHTLRGPWVPSQLQLMSSFHKDLETGFGSVSRSNGFRILNFYQRFSDRDEYDLIMPEAVSMLRDTGVTQVGHYRRHNRVGDLYLPEDQDLFIKILSDSTARRQEGYQKTLRLLSGSGHLNVQTQQASRRPIFTHLCDWLCDSSSFSSWLDGTSKASSQIFSLELEGVAEDTSILASSLIATIQKKHPKPSSQFFTLAHHHPRPLPVTKAQLMARLCSQISTLNPTLLDNSTKRLLLLPTNHRILQTHNESSKENILWRTLRLLLAGKTLGQMFIIIHIPPDSSLASPFLDLIADFASLAKDMEIRHRILVVRIPPFHGRPSAHGDTALLRRLSRDDSDVRAALKKDITQEVQSMDMQTDQSLKESITETLVSLKCGNNMNLYLVEVVLAIIAQHGLLPVKGLKNVWPEKTSINGLASVIHGLIPSLFLPLMRTGLLWVTHAVRPLTFAELGEVLTHETTSGEEPEVAALATRKFITMMNSLVEVIEDVVYIVNLDTCYELFRLVEEDQQNCVLIKGNEETGQTDRSSSEKHSNGHIEIAHACMAYLEKHSGTEETPATISPLLRYAVEHWFSHMKLSQQEATMVAAVSRFLADRARVNWWLDRRQLYRSATEVDINQSPTTRFEIPDNGLLPLADMLSYKTSDASDMTRFLDLVIGASLVGRVYNLELWPSLVVTAAQTSNLELLSILGKTKHLQDNATLDIVFKTGTEDALRSLVQSTTNPWIRQNVNEIVHGALKRGHIGLIDRLLEDFNINFGSFRPPLIFELAENGASLLLLSDSVWDFLKSGIDPELKGKTILHTAANCGHTTLVSKLLSTISDPNLMVNCKDDSGLTPLHLAAMNGHVAVVKQLLEIGPNIELQDEDGQTPLHIACAGGYVGIVTALLQSHASIGKKDHTQRTSLHRALENGHLWTSMLLLDELTCRPEQREGIDLEAEDASGFSVLMLATRSNLPKVVKSLVTLKVDVNHMCSIYGSDQCSLHLAADFGFCDVLDQLLLDNKEAPVDKPDEQEDTPLHRAAYRNHVGVVKKLITSGAKLDIENGQEKTPLAVACRRGHTTVARTLLQAKEASGSKLSERELDHVLDEASWCRDPEVLRLALDAGANKNKNGVDGSPLHLAAYNSSPRLVELLLLRRVDLEQRDSLERTALMDAARQGNVECLQLLVEAGADLDAEDEDGYTALFLASSKEHMECTRILLNANAGLKVPPDLSSRYPKLVDLSLSTHTPSVFRLIVDHVFSQSGPSPPGSLSIHDVQELMPSDNSLLSYATRDDCDPKMMEILLDKVSWDINKDISIDSTILHHAASAGNLGLVKCLVEKKPDQININSWRKTQGTPLEVAAREAQKTHSLEIVEFLLHDQASVSIGSFHYGAPLHAAASMPNFSWDPDTDIEDRYVAVAEAILKHDPSTINLAAAYYGTPLIAAVTKRGTPKMIQTLLRHKPDTNTIQTAIYGTALHAAAARGSSHIVELLINTVLPSLVPSTKDSGGKVPLHIAASKCHSHLIDVLSKGVSLLERDDQGRHVLHLAAGSGSISFARYVLEKHPSAVHDVDKDGWTPLHWACREGYCVMIELLLTGYQADKSARTNRGWLPVHVAMYHGYDEDVVDLVRIVGIELTPGNEASTRTERGLGLAAEQDGMPVLRSAERAVSSDGDNLSCDDCELEIYGPRRSCECHGYDLCFKCYQAGTKGLFKGHKFQLWSPSGELAVAQEEKGTRSKSDAVESAESGEVVQVPAQREDGGDGAKDEGIILNKEDKGGGVLEPREKGEGANNDKDSDDDSDDSDDDEY